MGWVALVVFTGFEVVEAEVDGALRSSAGARYCSVTTCN